MARRSAYSPEDVAYGRAHGYDNSEGRWVLVLMRAYAQRTVRLSLVNSIQQSSLIPALAKPMALEWLEQSGPLLVAYDRTIRTVIQQDGVLDKAALKRTLAGQLKAWEWSNLEAATLEGFLDERGLFDALVLAVQQNGEVFGDYKGVGQGGIPERVMQAFVGRGRTGMVATDKLLPEQLRELHSGKMIMVAITWTASPGVEFKENATDWWVANHAYSVLDYDDVAGTVRLRNPWGHRPKPDGSFKCALGRVSSGLPDLLLCRIGSPLNLGPRILFSLCWSRCDGLCSVSALQRFHNCCIPKRLLTGVFSSRKSHPAR